MRWIQDYLPGMEFLAEPVADPIVFGCPACDFPDTEEHLSCD